MSDYNRADTLRDRADMVVWFLELVESCSIAPEAKTVVASRVSEAFKKRMLQDAAFGFILDGSLTVKPS